MVLKNCLYRVLLATSITTPSVVLAEEVKHYCEFGNRRVELGEYVSHVDPVIVEETRARMLAAGKSESDIEESLKYSDWTVIHLECVRSYTQNTNYSPEQALKTNQKAAMLKESNYVLVPLKHQSQWLESMMNLK
ncbi:hypothetical protein [Vibrio sp. 1180_3]|uniref:hypothetical protein n=1 Tax=Vibrio sp. 1180_3 TaxID=2528832 RepID=UPI002404CFF3|nr:hypothetical protein [Vibrio sp. 1180_3]MDF9399058.1 hypothetical protein [Vibrio sp. 1180_3]